MKKIILAAIALILVSCTDESGARQALQAQGFNNITFTGYNVFGCGQDDTFHTGFTATNANGMVVSGTVCSGVLKGATVRF